MNNLKHYFFSTGLYNSSQADRFCFDFIHTCFTTNVSKENEKNPDHGCESPTQQKVTSEQKLSSRAPSLELTNWGRSRILKSGGCNPDKLFWKHTAPGRGQTICLAHAASESADQDSASAAVGMLTLRPPSEIHRQARKQKNELNYRCFPTQMIQNKILLGLLPLKQTRD